MAAHPRRDPRRAQDARHRLHNRRRGGMGDRRGRHLDCAVEFGRCRGCRGQRGRTERRRLGARGRSATARVRGARCASRRTPAACCLPTSRATFRPRGESRSTPRSSSPVSITPMASPTSSSHRSRTSPSHRSRPSRPISYPAWRSRWASRKTSWRRSAW